MRRPPTVAQFELELAGPGRAWYEPWAGRSPRALTGAAVMFSLGAFPAGGLHAECATVCLDREQEQLGQLLFSFD